MTATLAKWTIDEYHQMIDAGVLDDRQVELLKGEIVEMSPEGKLHAYSSHEAADYLSDLLGKRVTIRQAKPITLPNHSEPEPDIAIVKRLGREYLEHHPHPKNIFWLIEYSNTSLDKDLKIKSKVYAEASIAEYWVINLRSRELIIFRDPVNGEYQLQVTLTSGMINPLSFPDVQIDVSRLIR